MISSARHIRLCRFDVNAAQIWKIIKIILIVYVYVYCIHILFLLQIECENVKDLLKAFTFNVFHVFLCLRGNAMVEKKEPDIEIRSK